MKAHTFTMIGGALAIVAGALSAYGFVGMRDMFVGASVAMSLVSFFVPRSPR